MEAVRYSGLERENPGVMFLNAHGYPSQSSTLLVRAEPNQDPQRLLPTVRQTVRRANTQAAISDVAWGRELLRDDLLEPQYLTAFVGSFAAVAFLLAILGIYGVMEHFVRHHRRDIGVRVALGADPGSVVGLVMRKGMTLAILGSGVGLAGAVVLTRFMGALLFGVAPTDPLVLGSVLSTVVVVAMLACGRPALRAASREPREVLVET